MEKKKEDTKQKLVKKWKQIQDTKKMKKIKTSENEKKHDVTKKKQ